MNAIKLLHRIWANLHRVCPVHGIPLTRFQGVVSSAFCTACVRLKQAKRAQEQANSARWPVGLRN